MPIVSRTSPDCFVHIPHCLASSSKPVSSPPPAILFFITGNPGLIAYYHPFLSLLAQPPSAHCPGDPKLDTSECVIVGFSLGGFELEEQGSLYSLRNQISLTSSRIRGLVTALRDDYPEAWTRPPKVILLGHSVGAFIALEVIRLWNQLWRAPALD